MYLETMTLEFLLATHDAFMAHLKVRHARLDAVLADCAALLARLEPFIADDDGDDDGDDEIPF